MREPRLRCLDVFRNGIIFIQRIRARAVVHPTQLFTSSECIGVRAEGQAAVLYIVRDN